MTTEVNHLPHHDSKPITGILCNQDQVFGTVKVVNQCMIMCPKHDQYDRISTLVAEIRDYSLACTQIGIALLTLLDKMKALSHHKLAKAVEKKIRKNLNAEKPAPNQKKTCICAPTQHEGSFRCHLHRVGIEAQNKSSVNAKNVVDLDGGKQPRLSRFGRNASARACRDRYL